jgi:hypothetical protein
MTKDIAVKITSETSQYYTWTQIKVRTAQKWNTNNTRQSEQLKSGIQITQDSQNSSKVE